MLGLPDGLTVLLFDLDGVLTDTASVHDAAWTETFNAVLREQGEADGRHYDDFDSDKDYAEYVDGKPRADGVRDFLTSRGIDLPEGKDDDATDKLTVNGIGNRKNELLVKRIHEDGVTVFEGSRRYLEAARAAGLRCFVVSSSANTEDVLKVTGLEVFIEGRIDGVIAKKQHLAGKPSPDPFLAGARLARVTPGRGSRLRRRDGRGAGRSCRRFRCRRGG